MEKAGVLESVSLYPDRCSKNLPDPMLRNGSRMEEVHPTDRQMFTKP